MTNDAPVLLSSPLLQINPSRLSFISSFFIRKLSTENLTSNCFKVVELGIILDMFGKSFSLMPMFAANAAADNILILFIVFSPTLGACSIAIACKRQTKGVLKYFFWLIADLNLLPNCACVSNAANFCLVMVMYWFFLVVIGAGNGHVVGVGRRHVVVGFGQGGVLLEQAADDLTKRAGDKLLEQAVDVFSQQAMDVLLERVADVPLDQAVDV